MIVGKLNGAIIEALKSDDTAAHLRTLNVQTAATESFRGRGLRRRRLQALGGGHSVREDRA